MEDLPRCRVPPLFTDILIVNLGRDSRGDLMDDDLGVFTDALFLNFGVLGVRGVVGDVSLLGL